MPICPECKRKRRASDFYQDKKVDTCKPCTRKVDQKHYRESHSATAHHKKYPEITTLMGTWRDGK